MKIPKFVWVLGRTLGLGSAAIYVAAAYAEPVDAGCVKCVGQVNPMALNCESRPTGTPGAGSSCNIYYDPNTGFHCSTIGACTS